MLAGNVYKEMYSKPCQTSKMVTFVKIYHKALSFTADWSLNTPFSIHVIGTAF